MSEAQEMLDNGMPNIAQLRGFKIPGRILVIGCGGTGAYVVGHLSRLLSALSNWPDKPWEGYHLTIADGDTIEPKNLERQHFIKRDLGMNKAEALAVRYSAAFGIEIGVVPSYLEDAEAIASIHPNVVIGCVDNNASRQVVRQWFLDGEYYDSRGRFWIDSGNEENSGQVVCGFMPPRYGDSKSTLFSLPTVTEIYPAMLETGKFNSELSCAELAASAPQNMMANVTAATLVMNFAQKILRGKELRAHGAVFSVDNSFRTLLNTPENLAKVDPKRRRTWETTHAETV